jgi:hypothetical protein
MLILVVNGWRRVRRFVLFGYLFGFDFDDFLSGQSGDISIFDLNFNEVHDAYDSIPTIMPTLTYKAHEGARPRPVYHSASLILISFLDSIGCVAFRPTSAELLSVSGSRNYPSSDEEEDEDEGDVLKRLRKPVTRDRSIKLWHL